MRILLVEDDLLLGDGVEAGLRQTGFTVDWIKDGVSARSALEVVDYDGMVLDINLDALVETHDMRVLPENLDSLMRPYVGTATYVVDALDTIATKLVLARFAQDEGMPLVSAMGAAGKVHPEMLRFSDIYDTAVCPLCHDVRKRARKQGIERLCVLYSRERPLASRSGEPGTREALGTASFMPPIMGQMLAGYVIRRIVGMPDMGVEAR